MSPWSQQVQFSSENFYACNVVFLKYPGEKVKIEKCNSSWMKSNCTERAPTTWLGSNTSPKRKIKKKENPLFSHPTVDICFLFVSLCVGIVFFLFLCSHKIFFPFVCILKSEIQRKVKSKRQRQREREKKLWSSWSSHFSAPDFGCMFA